MRTRKSRLGTLRFFCKPALVGVFAASLLQAETGPLVQELPIAKILAKARQKREDLRGRTGDSNPSAPAAGRTTRSYVMTEHGLVIKHEVPSNTDPNPALPQPHASGRDAQTILDEAHGQVISQFDEAGEPLTSALLQKFRVCSAARSEQGVSNLNTYWFAALSAIAYLKYPIAFDKLKAMGFTDLTFIEGAAHVQVLVAKRAPALDSTGQPIKDSGLSVVAFRGTDDARDWLSNLNTFTTDISGHNHEAWLHEGFAEALNEVYAEVLRALDLNHDPNPLFLTGHSFGGALAMQMAIRLVSNEDGRGPLIGPDDDRLRGVYTYAIPRVGNDWARNIIDYYMNRNRNISVAFQLDHDPVTKVPFHWWGFRRFGLQATLPPKIANGDFGKRNFWKCDADVGYRGPDAFSWNFVATDIQAHQLKSYAKHFIPWRQQGLLDTETCPSGVPQWGPRHQADDPAAYRPLRKPADVGRSACDYTAFTWGGNLEI